MFDAVARRYDVTNDVLSLGQDRRWRRDVIAAVDPRPGERRAGPGRRHRHLEPAVRRPRRHGRARATSPSACSRSASAPGRTCPSPRATAPGCPFADDTFDAVTISFGLRNIVDPLAGLREMRRVTRPGGRLVVCEFSHPTNGAVPHGLPRVPHEGPARDLAGRLLLAGRLRLPRRVDPGLARPAGSGRRWSPRPAGRAPSGATSPAASSPCTAPPPEASGERPTALNPVDWCPRRACCVVRTSNKGAAVRVVMSRGRGVFGPGSPSVQDGLRAP